jgi:exodeoxyribonuclease-5
VITVHDTHSWNAQQAKALDDVGQWLRDPNAPQVFRLFGYAGTGKTTLARYLAEHEDGQVYFAAFTGKAASVLRAAGCVNATTIHSLIYRPFTKDRARLNELKMKLDTTSPNDPDYPEIRGEYAIELERVRSPGFELNVESVLKEAALVVVDEVSMVDERVGRDLLSFKKKVLVLGDPAQLPPVKGGGFFTNATPDILLTEIHRQAADNPIIRWATLVRTGGIIPYGKDGPAQKMKRDRAPIKWLASVSDQILTGKNETRRMINREIRKLRGATSPYPENGDRLICLGNNHELGILNGVTCECVGASVEVPDEPGALAMTIQYDGQMITDQFYDAEIFTGGDGHPFRRWLQFDFGYAMTVHKSQGSQWGRVALYDDGFWKREPHQRRRWLYTAITRAQESLTIVTS